MENEELSMDERLAIITALLPKGFEAEVTDDDTLTISNGDKDITLISFPEDKKYVVDGKTLRYEIEDETVNTVLIPFILSMFDGKVRL